MNKNDKIYVAGHTGLVGSALLRTLSDYSVITRTREALDLTDEKAVSAFFKSVKPDYVFLAAAKVGGIWANQYAPVDFVVQNLQIQINVIKHAYENQVKRLIFFGTSCSYPDICEQPIQEACLMRGPLALTHRPYAIAKIAGIEICWAFNREFKTRFLAVMPTNLYGPGDNYDLPKAHVIPSLIRKMHEAKCEGRNKVILWGSGQPRREFLYSDDLAQACLLLMQLEPNAFDELVISDKLAPIINIGCGHELSILEVAHLIADVVGFRGSIQFDETKPEGIARKILDSTKIQKLGWAPQRDLEEGIQLTYQHFIQHNEAMLA